MRHDIYTMPEVVFVSGQSNTFHWHLFTMSHAPFNADGCTGNFAVVDYSDQTGDPLISKPLKFLIGDNEVKNVAAVDLEPRETLGLHGKYIYQITIKDIDGEAEIPNHGLLINTHNINEIFFK